MTPRIVEGEEKKVHKVCSICFECIMSLMFALLSKICVFTYLNVTEKGGGRAVFSTFPNVILLNVTWKHSI